ncbi:MAG: (2Fe-2S)-binding protein [Solirubrobacteraceae bacterium]
MSASVELVVNGRTVRAESGSTVASTLFNAGELAFRSSPSGATRAPLCGMGICYECRVTIDGVAHQRACMTVVRSGMSIETAAEGHP